jgi:hypothetical protein
MTDISFWAPTATPVDSRRLAANASLFTAEILPTPALASPPARTKEDSVAFMEADAAVLLVAEDVVFVVRFIMLLLSSPITIVEPVLLLVLDADPFCC